MSGSESAALSVSPALGGLEMLTATYRDHAYALHAHPTYVVAVVTAGVERLRVGRTAHAVPPGSIILVNPEEPHDGEKGCAAGWSYRTCYPSAALMREVADDLGLRDLPAFAVPVVHAPALARAFVAAHHAAAAGGGGLPEAGMLTVLRAIAGHHGDARGRAGDDPSSAGRRVATYAAQIEADLGAAFSLTGLAAATGVTRFQVVRDFKRAAGMTPGQYIRDRRIRRACALIGVGLPLAAVAVDAGFADQSHMTRTFKAVKGVTPSAYRDAVSG